MTPLCTILSIGQELTLGLTIDTNANYLSRRVSEQGWEVQRMVVLPDQRQAIVRAVKDAARESGLVLITGGLGPTEDDRTREALADALDSPLEERPELLAQIEARFARFGWEMRPINRVQALVPKAAQGIENPHGTAPGIRASLDGAKLFAMPGVPREMKAMFSDAVLPWLQGYDAPVATVMRRLHLFGIGESTLGSRIAPWMGEERNPEIGTTVENSVITVRLLARGSSLSEADSALASVEPAVREELKDVLFGQDDDTLAGATIEAFRSLGLTLALAESCTGGMIAEQLVSVPGASEVFLEGLVTYANEAKIRRLSVPSELIEAHGVVSEPVVRAMASHLQESSGASITASVSGIAGPDGGTPHKPVGTTWFGLCIRGETFAFHKRFGSDRTGNRKRACNMVLDLLRRAALGLPLPGRPLPG